MDINGVLNLITAISVIAIVIAIIWSVLYVKNVSRQDLLNIKKRWIEQLPSIVSTLGVLGTFLGITIGLVCFDTTDLDASIPLLLSGLKTAFITSIAGMIGSLILSRIVNKVFDDREKGISDINAAANIICNSVATMSDANVKTMNALLALVQEQETILYSIQENGQQLLSQLKQSSNIQMSEEIARLATIVETGFAHIEKTGIDMDNKLLDLTATINTNTASLSDICKSVASSADKLTSITSQAEMIVENTALISNINDNVAVSLEALGNLDVSEQHVSEEIEKLSATMQTKITEINDVLKNQFSQLSEYIQKVNTQTASDILEATNRINNTIEPIRNAVNTISNDTANISSINDNIAVALEALGNLDVSEQHVSEEIDKLGIRMTTDIGSIVSKMTDTDQLLKNKFDEFTELLKKNDVLSLIEYMKSFAIDFQSQMNTLINKLVQDNFTELNKSVKTLNLWQQENKSMVEAMINEYHAMQESFEGTSKAIADVEKKTGELVADDGKLVSIIESLNTLLLEDKTFIKVMEKLKDAADINKNNATTLSTTSHNLSNWIESQKSFVNGIYELIDKLEEISKFRDYNEEFWKDVKMKMKNGVAVLNDGIKNLNNEVYEIDKHFYARLSTTLANLDACMQAMYDDHKNKQK